MRSGLNGLHGMGGMGSCAAMVGLLAADLGPLLLSCERAFSCLFLRREREILGVRGRDAHMTATCALGFAAMHVGRGAAIAPRGLAGCRAGFFRAPACLRFVLFDHAFLQSIAYA